MSRPSSKQPEQRQFGRRQTYLHAWVRIDGRPRIPCLVENISTSGALLTFDHDVGLPFGFRLVFAAGATIKCEVKHSSARRVGVYFSNDVTSSTNSSLVDNLFKRLG